MRVAYLARMKLRSIFLRRRADQELDDELDYHLNRQVEENIRAGMRPDSARNAAMLDIAGIQQRKEECRDARRTRWLENPVRDFRYGLRQLFRHKSLSAVAVLTLALGIGAATAVFSVARAVIFAPLPFPNPDRLVQIFEGPGRYQPGGENILSTSRPGQFQDWRERTQSFEGMAAVLKQQVTVMEGNKGVVADAFLVGDGFFELFGVRPEIGRCFFPNECAADGPQVVIVSDRMWRDSYGADPYIIGRQIVVDGKAQQVVGVMPPGFLPTRSEHDPMLWLPAHWDSATRLSRTLWGVLIYARLKPGVTLEQAQSDLDVVAPEIHAAYPNESGHGVVLPMDGYLFGHHQRLFTLLMAAAGLLMLVVCANVANLLLTRALERGPEFALRSALGASRAAILSQVIAESLVIAGAGGLAGIALAPLLAQTALAMVPPAAKIPRIDQVHLDSRVLAFSVLISVVAGLFFGVVSALRAAGTGISDALKSHNRAGSRSKGEGRLGDILVIAEVAVSLGLLVAGGALTRAFLNLLHSDPGFRIGQTVALRLSVPAYRYGAYQPGGKNSQRKVLYDRIENDVSAIAGVECAGVTAKLPFKQVWDPWPISIEGRAPLPAGSDDGIAVFTSRNSLPKHGSVAIQTVSPGYFGALGIPLLRGRLIDGRDRPDAPTSAVINEAAARKFFTNQDPIGKRITVDMTSYAPSMVIVGIVGDIRMQGMDKPIQPEVFWPMAQIPSSDIWLVATAAGETGGLINHIQRTVEKIDSEIGVVESITMGNVVVDSLWRERCSAVLIGGFAILSVGIALAGLYAVISHSVQRRMPELGIRVALGAGAGEIARSVLEHGLRITSIGIVTGAGLAAAAGKMLSPQRLATGELLIMIAGIAAMLLILTLMACVAPLRKAISVDPISILRSE